VLLSVLIPKMIRDRAPPLEAGVAVPPPRPLLAGAGIGAPPVTVANAVMPLQWSGSSFSIFFNAGKGCWPTTIDSGTLQTEWSACVADKSQQQWLGNALNAVFDTGSAQVLVASSACGGSCRGPFYDNELSVTATTVFTPENNGLQLGKPCRNTVNYVSQQNTVQVFAETIQFPQVIVKSADLCGTGAAPFTTSTELDSGPCTDAGTDGYTTPIQTALRRSSAITSLTMTNFPLSGIMSNSGPSAMNVFGMSGVMATKTISAAQAEGLPAGVAASDASSVFLLPSCQTSSVPAYESSILQAVYEYTLSRVHPSVTRRTAVAASAFPPLPFFSRGMTQASPLAPQYLLAPDPGVASLLTWGMYAGIDAGTRNGFVIFGAIGAPCVRSNLVQTPLLPLVPNPSVTNTLSWTPWRYYTVRVVSWLVPVTAANGNVAMVNLADQIKTLIVDTGTTLIMLPPDMGGSDAIQVAANTMNSWAGQPVAAKGGPSAKLVLAGVEVPTDGTQSQAPIAGPTIVFDSSNASYISAYSGQTSDASGVMVGAEDSCNMRVPSQRSRSFTIMNATTSAAFSSNGSTAVLGAAGLQGLYLEFQIPPFGPRALGIYQQPKQK
jgi:hypothetical protein